MSSPPCETPLLDLLKDVPADARAEYEHHSTSHSFIPYGHLCQRAAKRIEELEAERDNTVKFAHELWMLLEGDDQHFGAALREAQKGKGGE